jgi:hypothetical protein
MGWTRGWNGAGKKGINNSEKRSVHRLGRMMEGKIKTVLGK